MTKEQQKRFKELLIEMAEIRTKNDHWKKSNLSEYNTALDYDGYFKLKKELTELIKNHGSKK